MEDLRTEGVLGFPKPIPGPTPRGYFLTADGAPVCIDAFSIAKKRAPIIKGKGLPDRGQRVERKWTKRTVRDPVPGAGPISGTRRKT